MENVDIFIDLDNPLFVPSADMTLCEMIRKGGFHWPGGATCATQECDGEILWWDAPVAEVRAARKQASRSAGLLPIVGFGHQITANYYAESEIEKVARDWETAVVTIDDFLGATTK
ncbi:hypothetical protein [Photobacterium sp. R1]